MQFFPTIITETTNSLFGNRLLQIISGKSQTYNCEEAASARYAYEPKTPGGSDFNRFTSKRYDGVPLEYEIKTALFVARKADGTEIFIAAHIPADIELASNGVLKAQLKEKLGVTIIGDLDKKSALAKLNGYLKPLLEHFAQQDDVCLRDNITPYTSPEKREVTADKKLSPYTLLRAHIDKPDLGFGQLNPWTFLMLSTYSRDPEWQKAGVNELPIIHLVDSILASRQWFSTTNAGSRYVSMTIANTARAFEFLESGLKQAFGEDSKLYAVCDGLQKVKQL